MYGHKANSKDKIYHGIKEESEQMDGMLLKDCVPSCFFYLLVVTMFNRTFTGCSANYGT